MPAKADSLIVLITVSSLLALEFCSHLVQCLILKIINHYNLSSKYSSTKVSQKSIIQASVARAGTDLIHQAFRAIYPWYWEFYAVSLANHLFDNICHASSVQELSWSLDWRHPGFLNVSVTNAP